MKLAAKSGKSKWPTKADMDALQQEQAAVEQRRNAMRALMVERFGTLAEKSGLMDVDISDEEVEREFRGISDRFRRARGGQPVGDAVPKGSEPRSKETANGGRSTQS